MTQLYTVQDQLIIGELLRRAHAMGMKRRVPMDLLDHQIETKRFITDLGYRGIQEIGIIVPPNEVRLLPAKLPFESNPFFYTNRFFTIHREFYRGWPRYVMRIFRECSCQS